MKTRDIGTANYVNYHRGSTGYLKPCCDCGETIYMHRDYDDRWRPYESWAAGNVDEDTWTVHRCAPSQRRGSSWK